MNTAARAAVIDFEVPIMGHCPFQLSELFNVSSKDCKNRCEELNTTITKKTNLVILGDTFMMKFLEIGVDTITYLPDPTDSKNAISVLIDHAKFTKEEGCLWSKELCSKFAFMDWENNGGWFIILTVITIACTSSIPILLTTVAPS